MLKQLTVLCVGRLNPHPIFFLLVTWEARTIGRSVR